MADAKPRVFSIPVHRAFADALAAGLIDRFADDALGLAKGLVLLPSNRARSAVQAAAIALAEGGRDGLAAWAKAQDADPRDRRPRFRVVDDWGDELLGRPIPPALQARLDSTMRSTGSRPGRCTCASSVPPATYSITMYGMVVSPSTCEPVSKTATTLGWFIPAQA